MLAKPEPAFWLRFLAVLLLTLGSALALTDNAAPNWVAVADLPPEAQQTLATIRIGGPFPYARDGIVFGNFEKRLPRRPRGYYREYTVKTPGSRDRGARRIIAAGDPPGRDGYYYSDDHYRSFRRIQDTR